MSKGPTRSHSQAFKAKVVMALSRENRESTNWPLLRCPFQTDSPIGEKRLEDLPAVFEQGGLICCIWAIWESGTKDNITA